jgi:endonuclease/exonuclease/phosphatase family metal-dependent hydrolase
MVWRMRFPRAVVHALMCVAFLAAAALVAGPALSDDEVHADGVPDSRVASFNILGHSHTTSGARARKMGDSITRMGRTVKIIDSRGFDLIGFQEMQRIQATEFLRLRGATWSLYPGTSMTALDGENSIGWRDDVWTLVEATTQQITYFNGRIRNMPIVLLRHNATNQLVYVMNVHNPANTREYGNQSKWRAEAMRREIAKINELRTLAPAYPVIFTGDLNERESAFCTMSYPGKLFAANGGTSTDQSCTPPPRPVGIDWIMGTEDALFTDYASLRTKRIRHTTDHPVVTAVLDFNVAPATR